MNFKDYSKLDLSTLESKKEITLVKISEFGYPIVCTLKLDESKRKTIFLKDYAQYKNCVQIQGVLPRKRKASAFLIKPNQEFYIYDGKITEDMFNSFKKDIDNNVESWGMCFSDGALDRFVEGVDNSLLLIDYKDGIIDYVAEAKKD